VINDAGKARTEDQRQTLRSLSHHSIPDQPIKAFGFHVFGFEPALKPWPTHKLPREKIY
jgi:hypothetical protein